MKTHNPLKSHIDWRRSVQNMFEIERKEYVDGNIPRSADSTMAEAKNCGEVRGGFGDTGDNQDNFPPLRRLLEARLIHDTHDGAMGA